MKNSVIYHRSGNDMQTYLIAALFCTITTCEFIKNIYAVYAVCLVGLLILTWRNRGDNSFFYLLFMLLPIFTSHNISQQLTPIFKFVTYIITGIIISRIQRLNKKFIYLIVLIGSIHVFATLLFFVFRSAYFSYYYGYASSIFLNFPQGTNGGITGFTAGLNSHFSSNALYIIMELFAVISLYYSCAKRDFKKYIYIIAILITSLALFLTTKRAHLLFGIISVIIILYVERIISNRNLLRIIIVGGCIFLIMIFLYIYIPEVFLVFDRFSEAGDQGRVNLIYRAWGFFEDSPITGIGWLQFSNLYSRYDYVSYNVHNVYVQLLCETGVLGVLLFIGIIIRNLKITFNLLNNENHFSAYNRAIIQYCGFVQVFFVLYCFTGNCIYDNTFFYYMVSSGILWSYSNKLNIRNEIKVVIKRLISLR